MKGAESPIEELGERNLLSPTMTFNEITESVCAPIEGKTPLAWWIGFAIAFTGLGVLGGSITWLFWKGVGIWGNNSPVAWAWDITNFVWWIGIGHAGTLISAILFLFRQKWRTSINRFAEAMTIFAVICAGIFPGLHTGRPWFDYYMVPIPNQMSIWPNFKSPLIWDVFAVSTYATVSILFWYVGLIPDLATLRDRAKTKARRIGFGFFALGWRGSNRHWQVYERAYLILAGLSTPLVLSVHSVVSFDFATSVEPGWHTTIFPPYFVAGAVFSGFAMVLTLMLVCRTVFGLKNIVTMKHLELMNKIMLLTGSLVGYAYAMEFFVAWYSGNQYERYVFINRATGPYAWAYWSMISCNVIFPQIFWFKRFRTSIPVMFAISILINIGMWFERFVIIVTTLHRDYIPSGWGMFHPTMWDIGIYVGSFGLFFTLFLLFLRWIPMIAIAEVKGTLKHAHPHPHHGADPMHDEASAHDALPAPAE
ncbi:MAG: polysulfide reductase NrfD [Sandaracinaceae bacterium]|nr:polysulfide reductase NrfD [Sandaracinaceae bacterium]